MLTKASWMAVTPAGSVWVVPVSLATEETKLSGLEGALAPEACDLTTSRHNVHLHLRIYLPWYRLRDVTRRVSCGYVFHTSALFDFKQKDIN